MIISMVHSMTSIILTLTMMSRMSWIVTLMCNIDMTNFADIDNVLQVPKRVSFGESGSGTISPESGSMMAMSDFTSGVDPGPGEPHQLPSGVHLDMPSFADIDNVSQVPECVSFGELGSGTISQESGSMGAPPAAIGGSLRHAKLR